jgi:hypothetical protein
MKENNGRSPRPSHPLKTEVEYPPDPAYFDEEGVEITCCSPSSVRGKKLWHARVSPDVPYVLGETREGAVAAAKLLFERRWRARMEIGRVPSGLTLDRLASVESVERLPAETDDELRTRLRHLVRTGGIR